MRLYLSTRGNGVERDTRVHTLSVSVFLGLGPGYTRILTRAYARVYTLRLGCLRTPAGR